MQKAADPKIKRLSLGAGVLAAAKDTDSITNVNTFRLCGASLVHAFRCHPTNGLLPRSLAAVLQHCMPKTIIPQSPSAAPQSKTPCIPRQASAKDSRETSLRR